MGPGKSQCEANTGVDGLNIVPLRDIRKGEELTLDYAVFLDETMEPFNCAVEPKPAAGRLPGFLEIQLPPGSKAVGGGPCHQRPIYRPLESAHHWG